MTATITTKIEYTDEELVDLCGHIAANLPAEHAGEGAAADMIYLYLKNFLNGRPIVAGVKPSKD